MYLDPEITLSLQGLEKGGSPYILQLKGPLTKGNLEYSRNTVGIRDPVCMFPLYMYVYIYIHIFPVPCFGVAIQVPFFNGAGLDN